MPIRDRKYIEACLREALEWIEENDNLPNEKIDMGLWFSDLARSEILSFVKAPRYAGLLDLEFAGDVEPFMMILIPVDPGEVLDMYQVDLDEV